MQFVCPGKPSKFKLSHALTTRVEASPINPSPIHAIEGKLFLAKPISTRTTRAQSKRVKPNLTQTRLVASSQFQPILNKFILGYFSQEHTS